MTQIAGPQFNNFADYDCIVTAVFPDVQNFVRMKADPFFIQRVMPDHENFADTKRSRYGGIGISVTRLFELMHLGCLLDGLRITLWTERQLVR